MMATFLRYSQFLGHFHHGHSYKMYSYKKSVQMLKIYLFFYINLLYIIDPIFKINIYCIHNLCRVQWCGNRLKKIVLFGMAIMLTLNLVSTTFYAYLSYHNYPGGHIFRSLHDINKHLKNNGKHYAQLTLRKNEMNLIFKLLLGFLLFQFLLFQFYLVYKLS